MNQLNIKEIRKKLKKLAPLSIDMLKSRSPENDDILETLQAATLLDEVTVGDGDLRDMRTSFLSAYEHSQWKCTFSDRIRYIHTTWPRTKKEQKEWICSAVETFCLEKYIPKKEIETFTQAKKVFLANIVMLEENIAELYEMVDSIADELDLSDDEPVMIFLEEVIESLKVASIPSSYVNIEKAASDALDIINKRQTTSFFNRLLQTVEGAKEWIEKLGVHIDQNHVSFPPIAGFASNKMAPPAPLNRLTLYRNEDQGELNLLLVQKQIVLEWGSFTGQRISSILLGTLALETTRSPENDDNYQYWLLPYSSETTLSLIFDHNTIVIKL